MSNREQAINILNQLPEYKMDYIVAFLKGFQMDDEIEDDLFCEQMVQNYLNDIDPGKDKLYTLEECKKEWGLS